MYTYKKFNRSDWKISFSLYLTKFEIIEEPGSKTVSSTGHSNLNSVVGDSSSVQYSSHPKIIFVPLGVSISRLQSILSIYILEQCSDIKHYRLETFINWFSFTANSTFSDIFERPKLKYFPIMETLRFKTAFLTDESVKDFVDPVLTDIFHQPVDLLNIKISFRNFNDFIVRDFLIKYKSFDYVVVLLGSEVSSIKDKFSGCSVFEKRARRKKWIEDIGFQPLIRAHVENFKQKMFDKRGIEKKILALYFQEWDIALQQEKTKIATFKETVDALKKIMKDYDFYYVLAENESIRNWFNAIYTDKAIIIHSSINLERDEKNLVDMFKLMHLNTVLTNLDKSDEIDFLKNFSEVNILKVFDYL
eukprot:snap_masked-scaffold_18-processed-gene-1.40-mRNA-1 protein AED:1.00 eAED:1.00 QI:0/0/0/0/1/1/2/0/360